MMFIESIFKQVYYDLTNLSFKKILAKYGIPLIVFLLICNILGQLIIMFIPLQSLNQDNGRVTDIRIKPNGVNSSQNYRTDYALAITINNSMSYILTDTADKVKLTKEIKPGDIIKVYYPTPFIHFLGSDFISDVSQIEKDGVVLYSWKDQQNKGWFNISLFIAMLFFAWYLKLNWNNS